MSKITRGPGAAVTPPGGKQATTTRMVPSSSPFFLDEESSEPEAEGSFTKKRRRKGSLPAPRKRSQFKAEFEKDVSNDRPRAGQRWSSPISLSSDSSEDPRTPAPLPSRNPERAARSPPAPLVPPSTKSRDDTPLYEAREPVGPQVCLGFTFPGLASTIQREYSHTASTPPEQEDSSDAQSDELGRATSQQLHNGDDGLSVQRLAYEAPDISTTTINCKTSETDTESRALVVYQDQRDFNLQKCTSATGEQAETEEPHLNVPEPPTLLDEALQDFAEKPAKLQKRGELAVVLSVEDLKKTHLVRIEDAADASPVFCMVFSSVNNPVGDSVHGVRYVLVLQRCGNADSMPVFVNRDLRVTRADCEDEIYKPEPTKCKADLTQRQEGDGYKMRTGIKHERSSPNN